MVVEALNCKHLKIGMEGERDFSRGSRGKNGKRWRVALGDYVMLTSVYVPYTSRRASQISPTVA